MYKITLMAGMILFLSPLNEAFCSEMPLHSFEQRMIYINPTAHQNMELTTPDPLKGMVVPVFMIITGMAIAGIWTADIVSGKFKAQNGLFFKWKEGDNLLWPHIFAEYLTSIGLLAGGIALFNNKECGVSLSMIFLGALIYSGINSSGWIFAKRDRIVYGIPIWFSLAGGIISVLFLLN